MYDQKPWVKFQQCLLLLVSQATHWSLSTYFIFFKVGLITPVIATTHACFKTQYETKYMEHLEIDIRDFSLRSELNGSHNQSSEGIYSLHRSLGAFE